MQELNREFRIDGHETGSLSVTVLMRSHNADDYWDGNWVDSIVDVKAGGFTGRFGACLRAEEFQSFRDGLAKIDSFESSAARFETMEGQLSIEIFGDKLGHLSAKCTALDQAGIGNRLSFELKFDQTDLTAIIRGLNLIISNFPVIGDRNN